MPAGIARGEGNGVTMTLGLPASVVVRLLIGPPAIKPRRRDTCLMAAAQNVTQQTRCREAERESGAIWLTEQPEPSVPGHCYADAVRGCNAVVGVREGSGCLSGCLGRTSVRCLRPAVSCVIFPGELTRGLESLWRYGE